MAAHILPSSSASALRCCIHFYARTTRPSAQTEEWYVHRDLCNMRATHASCAKASKRMRPKKREPARLPPYRFHCTAGRETGVQWPSTPGRPQASRKQETGHCRASLSVAHRRVGPRAVWCTVAPAACAQWRSQAGQGSSVEQVSCRAGAGRRRRSGRAADRSRCLASASDGMTRGCSGRPASLGSSTWCPSAAGKVWAARPPCGWEATVSARPPRGREAMRRAPPPGPLRSATPPAVQSSQTGWPGAGLGRPDRRAAPGLRGGV